MRTHEPLRRSWRLATPFVAIALVGCTDPLPPERDRTPVISGDTTPLLIGTGRSFSAVGQVAWSVNGITGGSAEVGTIDADGRYTAPLLLPSADPVVIAATAADGRASRPFRVPLTPAPLEGDWYSYQPRVIRADRTAPVLLTVHAMPPVTRIMLTYKDGGTAELARRGGQLFQIAIPAERALALYTPGEARNHIGFIDHYAGPTRTARINAFVNVLDADVPAAAVASLATDAQASDHVLNLRWDGHMTPTFIDDVARRAYALLPDDFDFMAMVWPTSMTQNRYFSFVRNDTKGIGLGAIDDGHTFGSPARLQGTIQFPIDGMFDLGSPVASHEIGHRWINHLRHPAMRPGGAHWPIGDVASGVMGFSIAGSGAGGAFPFRIDSTAPGEYRLVVQQPDHRFNMLELYLMGLATPAEVPGFFVFADQNQSDQLRDGGILRGDVRRLTVDSLVAVEGPRIPAAGEAQRRFRLATVVLSVGRLLTADEMTFFSHMARRGEATVPLRYRDGFIVATGLPFALATRGRATLLTHLGRDPAGM